MFLRLSIILTILVSSLGSLRAGELTIDEAVSEALQSNPALKAKEASVAAAKAAIGVARSLDDPMAGVQFYDVPINTTDVRQGMETNYSISQTFPFPSKLILQGKIAKKSWLAEKSDYEAKRLEIIVKTEHAFHELYQIEKTLKINQELQGLFANLSASEEGKYTTGDKNSQDFLKSKVELDKLQNESFLLEAKEVGARAMLNILRNRNPGEAVALADLPSHDHPFSSYEEFEKRVLEKHPRLKASQYNLEASKANLTLAKQNNFFPNFQTKFSYAQRFGQQDAWTAEGAITVPFLWGKNRKMLKEARALKKLSEQEYLNVKNERLAHLRQSYAEMESGQKSVDLFQSQIVPHATIAFQSAKAVYESGKGDFLSLIDSARSFKEARLGALDAFVAYHRAMTHLKEAVGEENL